MDPHLREDDSWWDDSTFCDNLEKGCRKRDKSLKPQRQEGTEEAFLFAERSSGEPRKDFVSPCFWFPSFQAFRDNL